jgi:hypothetical protein
MRNKSVGDSFSKQTPTSTTLAMAQAVLKPLLSLQGGRLTKLTPGDNAISFELRQLSGTFKPKGCKILSEVGTSVENHDGERQTFYVLSIQGHLVRLAAFKEQASSWVTAMGSIYTGTDHDLALSQALLTAKRLAI